MADKKNEDKPQETGGVAADGAATQGGTDAAIANAEQVEEGKSDALQPGDEGYNPATDPVIPSSSLAEAVAAELKGSDKSPTRDALVKAAKQ